MYIKKCIFGDILDATKKCIVNHKLMVATKVVTDIVFCGNIMSPLKHISSWQQNVATETGISGDKYNVATNRSMGSNKSSRH